MALVDIPLTDHTTLPSGYDTIIEPYEMCYLRENSNRQMRLMFVQIWSLWKVQDELVVIQDELVVIAQNSV